MTTQTELLELIAVESADVYKQGILAGTLRRLSDAVEFCYDPHYRAGHGPPIATSLPLSDEPLLTPARSVAPYFAGLLPEGRRLTALRHALKTSADDDYSMLLAVGRDPIGDVQVVVKGEPCPPFGDGADAPSGPSGPSESDGILDESVSFVQLFADATGASPDRVGIAGVQDKVSGRMVSLPIRRQGGPGTILKFDPPEFPFLVRNEAFFLTMAAACGIETVEWKLVVDRDGRDGLLVTRFDRLAGPDGSVSARAVEDGCQISNRYPADKYSVSTEELINTMSRCCTPARIAASRFFRQVLFAVVTGNGDLHAKNFSLTHNGREWLPSPAYDLPSSAPYGDHTLALSVQGSREGQVSRKRAATLGASLGLPPAAVNLMIDEMTTRCLPWADRVEDLPFDERRRRDMSALIRRRCKLLSAHR